MHGLMEAIITNQEKKQINIKSKIKNIIDALKYKINNLELINKLKNFKGLNLKIVFFGFLILVFLIISISIVSHNNEENVEISLNDIVFSESKDDEIYAFLNTYFDARTNLRYDIIFDSFNKKFKNDIKDKEEQDIIKQIKYENAYVMSYDNIKIYETKGINENDKVLLITYDLSLSFTKDYLPEILLSYITKENDKIYFNDNLNLGITKYLNSVSRTKFVRELYNETKEEVEKKLKGNEQLKLVYNTLRQYNMNQNIDFPQEEIKSSSLDPIEDADKIKDLLDKNRERIIERQNDNGKN